MTCLLWLVWMAELDLKVVRALDPVPESVEHYLQDPYGADVAPDGRLFVVDAFAQVVFVWHPDGTFDKVIGKPGSGPGEFRFQSGSEPQAYLAVVDDRLVVYDGGKRALHTFSLEGEYQHTVRLTLAGGRTRGFYFLADGRFILDHHHYLKNPETFEIWLLGKDGAKQRSLHEMAGPLSNDILENGRQVGVWIDAFAAEPVSAFHAGKGELLVGYGDQPKFQIVDTKGKVLRSVKVPLMQQEVTKEDKAEFRQQDWLRNPFYRIRFPDKKAFYSGLLHVGQQAYLVYNETHHQHHITGLVVGEDGDVQGRVAFTCGENGRLLGYRGHILAVRTDEEGAFHLAEIDF